MDNWKHHRNYDCGNINIIPAPKVNYIKQTSTEDYFFIDWSNEDYQNGVYPENIPSESYPGLEPAFSFIYPENIREQILNQKNKQKKHKKRFKPKAASAQAFSFTKKDIPERNNEYEFKSDEYREQ